MEGIETVRETLHYVEMYRNKPIVIKLGQNVVGDAEVLGITKDIKQLNGVGIHVAVAHSHPELSSTQWVSIQNNIFIRDYTDPKKIKLDLNTGKIPIVYCAGEPPVSEDEAVAKLAISLDAEKLVYLTNRDGIFLHNRLCPQMTADEGREMLRNRGMVTKGMRNKLKAAIMACDEGVSRVHILNGGRRESALLREIFSCEGIGTMVYAHIPYHEIRPAKESEISDIVDLLQKAALFSLIVSEDIAAKINDFWVFVIDRQIHGCVMVREHHALGSIEIAYLTLSDRYEKTGALEELCNHAIEMAATMPHKRIVLPVGKNTMWLSLYPWFLSKGFKKVSPKEAGYATFKNAWVKEKIPQK